MKKMKIVIIVIAVIAIVTTVGVVMRKHFSDRMILDGPGMVRPLCYSITSCRYSVSGGMEGGSFEVEVSSEEDGKFYLYYYDCPYIGAEEKSYTIEVNSGVLAEIQNELARREFLSWGELEESESLLLDAPETRITVVYDGGETYTVSLSDELPKSGEGLFTEIYKIFEMYMQGVD